jgi:hypothetical protein
VPALRQAAKCFGPSRLARPHQLQNTHDFATDDNPTTNTQVSRPTPPTCVPTTTPSAARRSTRARCVLPSLRCRVPASCRIAALTTQQSEHLAEDMEPMIGGAMADSIYRASSSSVATARSSASRTARASPFSSSARTLARSTGPLCTDGRTRRVSLRLVAAIAHPRPWGDWEGQQL